MLEDLGSLSPSSSFMIPLMCYLHCTGLRGLACGEFSPSLLSLGVPYSIGFRLTYGDRAYAGVDLTWHGYCGFKDSLAVLCIHVWRSPPAAEIP